MFPGGIINIHPSLLPKYRGPTPVETAILDGAKETGVSLMQLSGKMDAGPVFAQAKKTLNGGEEKAKLAAELGDLGTSLLMKNLDSILAGKLKPKTQNEAEATYTKLIKKDDGIMDFSKPAMVLEREVRAFAGWPKSVTRVFGHKIIVTKSRVVKDRNDGHLVMQAHPGWLEITELIGPSGRTMSGQDFLRGYGA
jgi:methionyl-tRNA formyltransferase